MVVSDSTADVYPSAGTGGLILADGNAHRMVGRAVAGCRLPHNLSTLITIGRQPLADELHEPGWSPLSAAVQIPAPAAMSCASATRSSTV